MSDAQNQADQELNDNLDTPEAIEAEETAMKEPTQDEIKREVLTKYGILEDENPELVEKLVSDKLEERKRFSTAIKQKISWREKAKQLTPKEKAEVKAEAKEGGYDPAKLDEIIAQKVNEKLDAKVLEDESYNDELKEEIKTYASMKKITVKEALKSDYIQFRLNNVEKQARIDGASISTKQKSFSTKNFSNSKPSDFNLQTEEGKAGWEQYKVWLQSQE